MLDVIYIGTAVLFFAAFALYARRLRKTLTAIFMENLILGIISVALCVYLILAMVRPEKF